ncbi:DUF3617 domain-containing protein [Nitrosomonas sp.]|uniref:DUF3617 domain-containing protein n=1 Tax=Nitrosomonas sp. TaxID=42353 RepID=UPI0025E17F6B|nr:DUF3617 domain-containing protein [Nitrosomonas sp.]
MIPAYAHQHIRPGLWEVTTRSDLLALVPHIPAEHMQQLSELARRYGLKLPKIENGAATSHICITETMANEEAPGYFFEQRSGCTVQNATRMGNRYRLELICNNQHFQGNGTAEGTFINPENFTGSTEFDSTVSGTPVHASAQTAARWIGERCTTTKSLL